MVLPEEQHSVDSKWVFTIKWNPDGTLERFKAHLVSREFMQQYEVNYTETFTPTIQMVTLCAFFSIVTAEDLECHYYNIKYRIIWVISPGLINGRLAPRTD